MALKIDTNQSATAYHIVDGATVFPYAVDAQQAISAHPLEWSADPWKQSDATAARQKINEINSEQGRAPIPEPAPLSPEDQAALDAHNKSVAEAAARLDEYYKKRDEDRKIAEQVAADEAIVASAPPQPDPTIRRPFGRKGEPTPAELEQIRKRDAAAAEKKAADDKMVKDKADADKIAGNSQPVT